jgi:hypothetical protein
VHSLAEIARAPRRCGAALAGVCHPQPPGARGLGALRFRAIAALCPVPVVALGAWMRRAPRAALAALGRH